ncbi:MAG TPA: hypothetical protein VMC43_02005 [Candidatus Paceibacterota bacterium]|nr:hypothetical protein [Candidatus Paceibacterota bacterium]
MIKSTVFQRAASFAETFLPVLVAVTLFAGLIYGVAQQIVRQSANDPQVQMAEDAAVALAGGMAPSVLLPNTPPVDIATSLSPYLIVFDGRGTPIAASGRLHGNIPVPPPGVLEYALAHGEDRLTWQPERDVRIAAVVRPYAGAQAGFVLAGRSLRETESRTGALLKMVLLGWLFTLGAVLCAVLLVRFFR